MRALADIFADACRRVGWIIGQNSPHLVMQTFEMRRLKSYGFGEVLLGDVLMFMSVFSFVVAAAGED
jgi:hypothetical protein